MFKNNSKEVKGKIIYVSKKLKKFEKLSAKIVNVQCFFVDFN